jgi:ribosomal-protein-alanine N-acetyltransferase
VGFVIYELDKKSLHILNFAVAPQWRRHGVGEAMFRRLVGKLPHGRPRNTICCEVRETNEVAIKFFRSMGMTATGVLREHYVETDEDAYSFVLRVGGGE